METAAISIKVKGADAIRILTQDGQLLVGLKGKGAAAVGKGAALKISEIEAARIGAVGKGVALRSLEIEGGRIVGAGKALAIEGGEVEATYVMKGTGTAAKTAVVKNGVVAVKGVSAKAAAKAAAVSPAAVLAPAVITPGKAVVVAGKGAAAGSAAGSGAGTIWTGTGFSLGLGLGLGAMGPILLIAALGLIATGVYLFKRNQRWVPYVEEEA